jgi:sucrose synthase
MTAENLNLEFQEKRKEIHGLFRAILKSGKNLPLRTDLQEIYDELTAQPEYKALAFGKTAELFKKVQEAVVTDNRICFGCRNRIAVWTFIEADTDTLHVNSISVSEFLNRKEIFLGGKNGLEIDLAPFAKGFPRMKEPRSIGRGMEFLNRYLSSKLFASGEGLSGLLNFLRLHSFNGQQLLLQKRIDTVEQLTEILRDAEKVLESAPDHSTWSDLERDMMTAGFEPGWGRSRDDIETTMKLLSEILEAPDPAKLAEFLTRIPMISRIAILSPHGYFSQGNVFGLPDTGGQVVYILDQVRALEKELSDRLYRFGLDIKPSIAVITRLIPDSRGTGCDNPKELISGTDNAYILRVPFREADGRITEHWISRFEIWPYLERFTDDVEKELYTHFGTRPDLVIGNYSDGNLVSTLLSAKTGVTQCTIAHALEKSKYLFSALYWQDMESQYHFSAQFTADLISMNAADFVISSTYQEIAGTEDTIGQYESYKHFTMPGLYRVVDGIDVYDPKFNIVSPGADENIFFSYKSEDYRLMDLHEDISRMVFSPDAAECRGTFSDPEKPIIFTMARLDRIKNITGLVEWFGENEELKQKANLLVIAGSTDMNSSSDGEERTQIAYMHELMNRHGLDGSMRWLGTRLEKPFAGELYRFIADKRGVFVQPALFEAFGLTVIEAMASGLPTFATCFGGPLEIIENGVSGFHINPNKGAEASSKLLQFLTESENNPEYWLRISEGSLRRVAERYNWKAYARKLVDLSCVYGFWKYVSDMDRKETGRYLEMFYELMYKRRAAEIG